jgi:predicted lipoprotein with Yx(FWY)xxD motif
MPVPSALRVACRCFFIGDGINHHLWVFVVVQGSIRLRLHHLEKPMKKLISMAALAAAATLGGCATMNDSPVKTMDGVLVGAGGMTLYTFDRDAAGSGKSVCNGPCATNWPPLMASKAPGGDYSVITRDDGKTQLAYKGKPLYYWIKDTKPGDKTGEGVNQVWRTARP